MIGMMNCNFWFNPFSIKHAIRIPHTIKHYICQCKWKNIALSFKAFKGNVKYELKLKKEGEKLDKNYLPFKWKW